MFFNDGPMDIKESLRSYGYRSAVNNEKIFDKMAADVQRKRMGLDVESVEVKNEHAN